MDARMSERAPLQVRPPMVPSAYLHLSILTFTAAVMLFAIGYLSWATNRGLVHEDEFISWLAAMWIPSIFPLILGFVFRRRWTLQRRKLADHERRMAELFDNAR